MKDIILLGGNILNGGIVAKKKEYGADRVIVFDWNEAPAIQGDIFIRCDIKDDKLILEHLERLGVDDILFVYTSADLAVPTQQVIHRHYGLMAAEENAIQRTLKKSVMTDIWNEAGLLNRESFLVENITELTKCDLKKKWIVKPNLCSGSRGITILENENLAMFEQAYQRAKQASWDDRVIVEEFVKGNEFTIEMIGDSYGNVSVIGISKKHHTPYNVNNKIAVKLHYNANDVADEELAKLAEHGIKCYKALGLHTSFGHLEVIMDEKGTISPLEIGARSSGYIASHCVDELIEEAMMMKYASIIRGGEVKNGYVGNKNNSSMLFFYDIPEGKGGIDTDITKFLPEGVKSLAFDRSRICKGYDYTVIDGDGERYGFEILAGKKEELTIENVCEAEHRFLEVFLV